MFFTHEEKEDKLSLTENPFGMKLCKKPLRFSKQSKKTHKSNYEFPLHVRGLTLQLILTL